MANKGHLEILMRGVSFWNEMRYEIEYIMPDFKDAQLSNLDLARADFVYADFSYAELKNTNLTKCDLTNSKLKNANLEGALLTDAYLNESDLGGANLSKTILFRAFASRAKFSNALFNNSYCAKTDFSGADLSGVDFTNSDLSNSDLSSANLTNCDFTKAKLTGANLSRANLTNAKLVETNIEQVVFIETVFSDAIMDNCLLNNTVFGATNLGSVRNIESSIFGGVCILDFQTIQASRSLPKRFLRQLYLPENYIEYLPDFYEERPIKFHPVFLSYSWVDKPFASKLHKSLISRGVHVWYDERKLLPGDNLIDGVSKGIDLYDKFILVCSRQSLQESWWVDKELNRALDKEIRLFKERGRQINTIIPITIDDYVFKEWDGAKRSDIHRYNIGDFTGWQDDAKFELALDKLVAALNADRGEETIPSYL